MPELSVAVVGLGGAGQVHLGCWANVSGARIAALCDRDGALTARTAQDFPDAAAFTDIQAMLAGQAFDIVDICTPADQHYPVAEAALRAGAHVLCEKPLTPEPETARALAMLADERERLLMTAFCHRFHPPLLFAKELLENDDLGRLVQFRCRFSGFFEEAADSPQADPEKAGGALRDTAIHGIDLFRHFAGEVRHITGQTRIVNPNLLVEDTVTALLEAESGAMGVVEVSWSTPGGNSVVEIYGTAGACIVDYADGAIRTLTADQPVWRRRDESGLNRFERMIAHFADAARGLQAPLITGEDGARAVELCAEILRQNRQA